MLLAAHNNPSPVKPICLLTAITAMALAARIHGTDKAVMATAYRMLPRVGSAYQGVVLKIMNSPSPLKHITVYVASMPEHILTMKVSSVLPPYLAKANSAA